jgi:hypothetical protein
MRTPTLIALGLGLMVLAGPAQEKPAQFDVKEPPKTRYLDWQDPEWWQRDWNRDEMKFSLGGSEYAVSGPFAETFRVGRGVPFRERSLGQKILSLPIVNLFVPQPMPKPSGEGKYLVWGQREEPWSNLGDRGIPGPVGLMSVRW